MHIGRNYGKPGRNPRKGIKLYTCVSDTIKTTNLESGSFGHAKFMWTSVILCQIVVDNHDDYVTSCLPLMGNVIS